jgi:peptidoglycan/LPS O-acetylase OafA/YrhL
MDSAGKDKSFLRIPELDGIRGIAILSVLIWHYFPCLVQVHPQPRSLLAYSLKAVSFTWSGVDLFFVLSGFLIGGILMDNKESLNYFKVFLFSAYLSDLSFVLCLVNYFYHSAAHISYAGFNSSI